MKNINGNWDPDKKESRKEMKRQKDKMMGSNKKDGERIETKRHKKRVR